jgi:transposase
VSANECSLSRLTLEELATGNEQLRVENAALKQRLAELEALVKELQAQLAAALRAGKRQAAPFSKGVPKAEPKTPGRKVGHPAAQRPKPQRVDRVVEATLPTRCPSCGGPVMPDQVEVQYQVDIPPVQPVVTQFNVHVGHCTDCQRRLQGQHPQQTSDALAAAGGQVGPRALTLAAQAKHELGVPYGKISRWFESAFGLTVCRAAWARADQRLARRGAPVYLKLIDLLRQSHSVAVDETGWKVAGQLAWLWVFTNEAVTVYLIDPTRAHEVVERVLGEDFAGVLQCDCSRSVAYDPLAYDQQKCLQHLLRRCDALTESKSRRAVVFSRKVASLLRGAIHLKHRLQDQQLSSHGFDVARGRLAAALDRLLAGHYTDPDNAKLAKLLRKHRAQLLVFLDDEAVAPTNARAEQEIRPAVVVRKTSACNRSPTGAATHAILTSLIRTCRKQGQSFLALGLALWCRTPLPLPKALRPRITALPALSNVGKVSLEALPAIALPQMSTR